MGDVGSALARSLLATGWRVTGLRRSPTAELPTGVVRLTADLRAPESLKTLSRERYDTVVFCAAAGASSAEDYQRTYVEGLRNVIQALDPQSSPRLVFTSSTGVYHQDDGGWVDETSPALQEHFSGRAMREAEAVVRGSGRAHVIVRLGGIYGPGRAGMIDRLKRGAERLRPGAARYLNLVHRDDAAAILTHVIGLATAETLYLGVDGVPAGRNEMLLWLAEQLRIPPPPLAETEEAANHRGNKRCSSERLRASGYVFRYPDFRDGYGELIQFLR